MKPTCTSTNDDEQMEEREEELEVYRGVDHKGIGYCMLEKYLDGTGRCGMPKYFCKQCEFFSAYITDLEAHTKLVHSDVSPEPQKTFLEVLKLKPTGGSDEANE